MPRASRSLWLKARQEYVTTGQSCREIGEKLGLHPSAVSARAVRENWTRARDQHSLKELICSDELQNSAKNAESSCALSTIADDQLATSPGDSLPTAAEFDERIKRELIAWLDDVQEAKEAAPSLGYSKVDLIKILAPPWARTTELGRRIFGLDQDSRRGTTVVNVGLLGSSIAVTGVTATVTTESAPEPAAIEV
jgi:hypothetical protein